MIAVIGDIHGCYYTMYELVERIKKKYKGIQLYCVGDLVDRGKFNYEVVNFVKNEGVMFTPGNHDYMFYYFIRKPEHNLGKSWLYNGYETTIASYNNKMDEIDEHLDLIETAPIFFNLDDCFISHAGISVYYKSILPAKFMEDTSGLNEILIGDISGEHSILWNRDELLDIGKLQVVGHTRQEDVNFIKRNNTVYIDTSVYTGNKLSAVIVEENKIIDTISIATYADDIN
jgi:serine/threonine protein phosphatase 1